MMMTEMTEKCVISLIQAKKKYPFFREIIDRVSLIIIGE